MVWVLRVFLGALVLGYAAWLSLPLAEALAAGSTVPQIWSLLASTGTPQAISVATLLPVIIAFFALGGLATVAGLTWAPALYFLGVVGDIALRLAVAHDAAEPAAALDLAARADAALRPLGVLVETTPLTLAALLAVGLCILATGVWRGQNGAALTRVWTQFPVWA